jgi:hypothetical protein
MIVLVGSYYPFRPDHFGYYVPSLEWLNNYGLIRGIGNIDWCLGQMSFLHLIQAGIDQTIDQYLRINIFISILFLIYIFERKAYLMLFFIPFHFLFIQTPSPDVVAVFISLMVVNELVFNYKKENFRMLLLISVLTFVIRPFAFWLTLFTFIMGIYKEKKEWVSYKNYIFPVILVSLFIVKNVHTSSLLAFPVTQTAVDTYWSPAIQVLEQSDIDATIYSLGNHFNADEVKNFTLTQRLYHWLSMGTLQTIINISICAGIVLFGIFCFRKKRFIYNALFGVVLLKVVVVFLFSGQFRFILEGIYPLIFILLHDVWTSRIKILAPALLFFGLSTICISYPPLIGKIFPSFKLTKMMTGFSTTALIQPGFFYLQTYKSDKIGNLDFNISTGYKWNFDTPPPAFSVRNLKNHYDWGIFPQLKDTTNLHKGFYIKKLSADEKEKLKNILKNLNVEE